MYVTSASATEMRLTLEATVDLVNVLNAAVADGIRTDVATIRELLDGHGFTRAAGAAGDEVERLDQRVTNLLDRFTGLPDEDALEAISWVNRELAALPIAPAAVTHDGVPLHIHWTPTTATFDDQVMADLLMALTQELCDHGTQRFGRCAASDCDDLYYDTTRNGSRRFCGNPRCASRTHTADHRARRRNP